MNGKILLGALIAGVLLYIAKSRNDTNTTQQQDWTDTMSTKIDEAIGAISGPTPVAGMSTSQAMCDIAMARESYQSKPYHPNGEKGNLLTWGYGHQGTPNETPPDFISKEDAATLFKQDVVQRGEYWVKLYVTVPLTQNQFDALVSIALNMSSKSFKKFADSVNAGNGIDAIAQASVAWVAPTLTRGIQNRRNAEMNMFDNGVYA